MGALYGRLASVGLLACVACGGSEPEPLGRDRAALDAFCQVDLTGVGLLEAETDYLPHVVACENGAAGQAALEAQAVAARSYLYYKLESSGSISDGQGDQVYTCGRPPGPEHFAAVEATSGQVLRYQDTQVAAFYVAGARNQPAPTCRGSTDDPTDTEKWVTYNEGLAGDAIEQTMLGFVSPSNHANRGCMSQNGADCLSDDGHLVDEILRFYYGADIEVVTAVGPCVLAGGAGADAGTGPDSGSGGGGGGDDDGGVFGGCRIAPAPRRAPAGGAGSACLALFLFAAALYWHKMGPRPPRDRRARP